MSEAYNQLAKFLQIGFGYSSSSFLGPAEKPWFYLKLYIDIADLG